MTKFQIIYNGQSKILKRLCEVVNQCAALGETHDTAFYGDLGKEAYEHSQFKSGNPHNVTAADLGLEGVNSKLEAIMYAIGMIFTWETHKAEPLQDHDGDPICFHGANAQNYNYLIYH